MKNYLIIALSILVAILLFLRGCDTPKQVLKVERYTDTIIETDTVIKEYTKVHTKLVPSLIYLDTNRIDLSDTNVFNMTYVYNIEDSLLNATISVKEADIYPEVDFKYTLKSFEINNTTIIKDSIYTKEQVLTNKLYVGGSLLTNQYATLGVTFAEKHGNLFELGIGSSQNGNIFYQIGYKKLITFRKNGN